MTPLRLKLETGRPIFDQVVFAAIRAFVSGELRPGDPFPSIRVLSEGLKIHPNTAHKVIQHLIQERWLESVPGVGTVVARRPAARSGDRKKILKNQVEQLAVEAKRVGLSLSEVTGELERCWAGLEQPAARKEGE